MFDHPGDGHLVPLFDRRQIQPGFHRAVNDRFQGGREPVGQAAVNRFTHHECVAMRPQDALVGGGATDG